MFNTRGLCEKNWLVWTVDLHITCTIKQCFLQMVYFVKLSNNYFLQILIYITIILLYISRIKHFSGRNANQTAVGQQLELH